MWCWRERGRRDWLLRRSRYPSPDLNSDDEGSHNSKKNNQEQRIARHIRLIELTCFLVWLVFSTRRTILIEHEFFGGVDFIAAGYVILAFTDGTHKSH